MRLLPLLLILAVPAFSYDDDSPAIQRSLGHLSLGYSIERVRKIYPPLKEWHFAVMPRGLVERAKVDRASAKSFPKNVDFFWLGMKKNRLAEIQLVYDAEYTREKPAERLAGDLSLIYGVPRRSGAVFWWSDGKTVLRVFNAELAVLKNGAQSRELRTSIQIFDHGLSERTDR